MKSYLLIPTCLVLAFSCKKDPPVVPEPTLSLTAVDASCTEAWLKATTTQLPATVRLLRDGQRVSDLRLLTSDSLLVDEGLLPRQTYAYQLQRLNDNSTVIETSPSVQVTTMDTTSHNWIFDPPVLLGDGSSSVLYDVAIVRADPESVLVFAVGELYPAGEPSRHNVAIWDGNLWRVDRLNYQGFPPVIRSIFAFDPNDVWLDPWFHWNGREFQQQPIDPIFVGVNINKMWGSQDGSLYVVGNGGFIAVRSPSGTWRRLESGTTLPLNDVWGGSNRIAGENIVLATGGDRFMLEEKKVLRFRPNGECDSLVLGTIHRRAQSVWFDQHHVYVVGDGLLRLARLDAWKDIPVPEILLYRIRGAASNDLWIAGDFGVLLHYNGFSIHEYPEVGLSPGVYKSIAVTKRLVVAVGWVGSRAVAMMGKK